MLRCGLPIPFLPIPPPMVEFKSKADQIIKERWGIEVEHRCAMKNGEKLTYEKLFYHVPNRKPETLARYEGGCAGRSQVSHSFNGLGATDTSKSLHFGFPFTIGSWCKKLKDGSYLWLSNLPQSRELVYPTQNQSNQRISAVRGGCRATSDLKTSLFQKLPCTRSEEKYCAVPRHCG